MDLGTVRSRLMENHYKKADECLSDIFLIFRNCYVYNRPGDDVVDMAMELEKYVREKFESGMPFPEVEVELPTGSAKRNGHQKGRKRRRCGRSVCSLEDFIMNLLNLENRMQQMTIQPTQQSQHKMARKEDKGSLLKEVQNSQGLERVQGESQAKEEVVDGADEVGNNGESGDQAETHQPKPPSVSLFMDLMCNHGIVVW